MASGRKKKSRRWGILVTVLLVAAALLLLPRLLTSGPKESASASGSYTVGRGDVEATITGSGALTALDTVDVLLPEGVKIDTIFVKAGDSVAEGDVLATFDAASLQYRAAELSAELAALDQKLGARKTKSTIKAPVKGRVKYLPAVKDDDVIEAVNRYGSLLILSTDGLMRIQLTTSSTLLLNEKVNVKWNGGTAEGKVTSRTEDGYLITLKDDNAPYQATADVFHDSVLIGTGVLEINAPLAIFGNGGIIEKVHYALNASVSANDTLFTLDNEPVTDQYRKNLADRAEKAKQLQTVLAYQNNPHVLASVAGTVNDIAITEGKKTVGDSDSGEMTAFTLGTGGATKMTVDVDELDVGSVAVGQSATVTLDAFAAESFHATVTRISHIGTASGSITVYATDLRLDYDARLMDGMNGSAVILSSSVQDVLVIPMAAIHEDAGGSYVYRLGLEDEQTKLYIATGLSDGTNAEVISGLNDGDRIAYTAPTTTGLMFPMGFGGGMNRGMPAGGVGNER